MDLSILRFVIALSTGIVFGFSIAFLDGSMLIPNEKTAKKSKYIAKSSAKSKNNTGGISKL